MSHPENFVFFYVGDNLSQPAMLADSIRWSNPDAIITFVTDETTADIPSVHRRINVAGDRRYLMTYRLKAFSEAALRAPAIYLDTDMLVVQKINISELLGSKAAVFCSRSFDTSAPFNGRFKGLDFSEYDQLPIGTVYPFLACATITSQADIWAELLQILLTLPQKFHDWYGDQEAMKIFVQKHSASVGVLAERQYGCLPEYGVDAQRAAILHFKGQRRKPLMSQVYKQLAAYHGLTSGPSPPSDRR